MNIVLLGPPASGKGTCSEYLQQKCNMTHISMGDLLREYVKSGTEKAQLISKVMSEGKILAEDITADLLRDYLKKIDLYDNILLDGYPRGLKSVEYVNDFLKIDMVIVLEASLGEIKNRILNRLICPDCGKVYSKNDGAEICSDCKIQLVVRDDDTEAALNTRMAEYERLTVPVIEHYKRLGIAYVIKSDEDMLKQLDVIINKTNLVIDKTDKANCR